MCGDNVLAASTSTKEEKIEEIIQKRKLMVHKVAIDLETAENIVDRGKTRFFAKLGLLRPRHKEIEVESVQLFYDPFVVAKASYFLDFYEKKTYRVKVGDESSEVVLLGQTFKPKVVKERVKGIVTRPHKEVLLDGQERVIHKAATHIALNRRGREIDPTELPSAPAQAELEKILKECGDKARKLRFPPEHIINVVRKRTVKRPPNIGRIAKEVFEVTENALVYTPVYEARCQNLKTGEIKIIPISGVTSKMLFL